MDKQIVVCGRTAHMYEHAAGVCRALNAVGLDARIAGGFIRDVIFGQAPKDVDIVVPVGLHDSNHQDAVDALQKILPDTIWRWLPFYGEREIGDRVFSVFQSHHSTRTPSSFACRAYSIDILLYRADSIEQAATSFDDTLNMLTLDAKGQVTSHSPRMIRLGVIDSPRPISDIRREKMLNKHKTIRASEGDSRHTLMLYSPEYLSSFTIIHEETSLWTTARPIPF